MNDVCARCKSCRSFCLLCSVCRLVIAEALPFVLGVRRKMALIATNPVRGNCRLQKDFSNMSYQAVRALHIHVQCICKTDSSQEQRSVKPETCFFRGDSRETQTPSSDKIGTFSLRGYRCCLKANLVKEEDRPRTVGGVMRPTTRGGQRSKCAGSPAHICGLGMQKKLFRLSQSRVPTRVLCRCSHRAARQVHRAKWRFSTCARAAIIRRKRISEDYSRGGSRCWRFLSLSFLEAGMPLPL